MRKSHIVKQTRKSSISRWLTKLPGHLSTSRLIIILSKLYEKD